MDIKMTKRSLCNSATFNYQTGVCLCSKVGVARVLGVEGVDGGV